MLEILVAQAVIFRTEKQRDFTFLRGGGNFRRSLSRRPTMASIESGTAGGADDQRAVGNRRADRIVASGIGKNVSAMHGHGARPEASRARLPHDGELGGTEIFHRARHRSYVARAVRANHDDAEIAQHTSPND